MERAPAQRVERLPLEGEKVARNGAVESDPHDLPVDAARHFVRDLADPAAHAIGIARADLDRSQRDHGAAGHRMEGRVAALEIHREEALLVGRLVPRVERHPFERPRITHGRKDRASAVFPA